MTEQEIKNQFQKLKKLLENGKIKWLQDYNSDNALGTINIGNYLYEFNICYKVIVNDYVAATYDAPEESDATIEVTDVKNLMIYKKGEFLELDESKYSELEEKTLGFLG